MQQHNTSLTEAKEGCRDSSSGSNKSSPSCPHGSAPPPTVPLHWALPQMTAWPVCCPSSNTNIKYTRAVNILTIFVSNNIYFCKTADR